MFGLFRSVEAAAGPAKSRRPRPVDVEALEERSVPAVFKVTNQSDHNPGSLRAAVEAANAHAGADTIQFAPQLTGTITLTTGAIGISDDLVINGPGANKITVSGNNASRIFVLSDAAPITVEIKGLKLTKGVANVALDDDRGAILAGDNDLTLRGCVISGNTVTDSGGGVFVSGGRLTAVNTIFANNRAEDGAGARVEYGRLSAVNCQFRGNSAEGSGGGLYLRETAATLDLCVLSKNTAGSDPTNDRSGGGLYFRDGSVSISNTTISQNTADFGGGICGFEGGRLTVRGSTISGNRANGSISNSEGGGGAFLYNVQTLIVNSTVSGNVDQSGAVIATTGGGGIHLYGGRAVIRNSTIAFNSTVGQGGGIFLRNSQDQVGRLSLASTIVSNSTAPAGNFDVARAAGEGVASAVFSLIQRLQPLFLNGTDANNLLGVNPRLLPLADNGGPTLTHAFTVGSPVRNAGRNPDQLQFDQRGPGFPRVKDGAIDIGALEL